MARRDQSICPFTESPGRCRALLTSDARGCSAPDGAPDCLLALEYWQGPSRRGFGSPLVDPNPAANANNANNARTQDSALQTTIDLRWTRNEHPQVRIQGPRSAAGISWPAGKSKPAFTEDTTRFWGAQLPVEAAQVTWNMGDPAVKLAFVPGGESARGAAAGPALPQRAGHFRRGLGRRPAHISAAVSQAP